MVYNHLRSVARCQSVYTNAPSRNLLKSAIMLKNHLAVFLCAMLSLAVICHAYPPNPSHPSRPPHPVFSVLDVDHDTAKTFTMDHAIGSANTHFNLFPGHLSPSWTWPKSPVSQRLFSDVIRDQNARFVQINRHAGWTLFAAPWRVTWPGTSRENRYVLFLNVHPTKGVVPVGYSDFSVANLHGRGYDFWTALAGEARVTQEDMLRRFPHLAHV